LQPQLKAIMKASRYGKVKILFPMVSSIDEVKDLVDLAQKTEREFLAQIEGLRRDIPLGVMVEENMDSTRADDIERRDLELLRKQMKKVDRGLCKFQGEIGHLEDLHCKSK